MAEHDPGPSGVVGRNDGAVGTAGLVSVLIAGLSFLPIVQDSLWWLAGATMATAAVLAVAAGRRLGMPNPAAALLGLCTIPLLATAFDGDGHGIALVIPTAQSSDAVMSVLGAGIAQISTDSVPAVPTAGIVLLVAIGFALAAVVVDTVAVGYRAPLGAMLVPIALAVVPGKALRTDTSGVLLVAVAVAVLAVIAADRRRRRLPPRIAGLGIAAAGATAIALLVQVVLPVPYIEDAGAAPGPLFGAGADPLIRLGQNLRQGADTSVLSYTTSSTQPVYLRLAVLEQFTGRTWYPNDADGVPDPRRPPAAKGLSEAATTAVTTRVRAASPGAIAERLPLPYPATSVQGAGRFAWDVRGLALVRRTVGTPVTDYTVQSLDVKATPAQLRAAGSPVPEGDRASLALPTAVPARITSTAAAWTRGATTPYAKALAIQNHLASSDFRYDETTPARDDYNGDGLQVIDKFLQVKAGYCIHYASTMAVMARVLHIPSRVVVGYQPGVREDGQASRFAVTSNDLHAWPELYFDGIGWTRFEPTPGRGDVPAYAPLPSAAAAASDDPKTARSAAAPSAAPSASANDQVATDPARAAGRTAAAWAQGIGAGLVVVLLLLTPGAVRTVRRRRRFGRFIDPGTAALAWREVLDTAADLGVPLPVGASPRATAAALARALGHDLAAVASLDALRSAYERAVFGALVPQIDAVDVKRVIDRLREQAGAGQRAAATLAPRSLAGAPGSTTGRVVGVATGVQVVTTGERRARSRRTPGPH